MSPIEKNEKPVRAVFRVGQLRQALPYRHRMVGNGDSDRRGLSADRHLSGGLGVADPLNLAARQERFRLHVVQAVFKTRRPQVGYQNFHSFPFVTLFGL